MFLGITGCQENLKFCQDQSHHKILFDRQDDGGVIVFHDAWLRPESLANALNLDVMTPHHPK